MYRKTYDARCGSCGRHFFYTKTNGLGRGRIYCDDCGKRIEREKAAARVRRQRARQKENRASEVSASPVVIGSANHTPVGSSRQAPIQKTSPAMFSPARSSLGQREALDLESYRVHLAQWESGMMRQANRHGSLLAFLFI